MVLQTNPVHETINPGIPFDETLLNIPHLFDSSIIHKSSQIIKIRENLVYGDRRAAWLLRAISVIDLTTLSGDDTPSNVLRLCKKAASPISPLILNELDLDFKLTCAAVCVYPARVGDAAKVLKDMKSNLPIASVATGFPAGQTSLKIRLEEIKYAVEEGATEIDIVINRQLAICQNWEELYNEIRAMKIAAGTAHLKAILAVGELPNFTSVYKAGMVAMMAGADFIKTSTGKESVNATIPVGIVMCRSISDYEKATNFKVGLKPAGGLRVANDALNWLVLVKEELGNEWLNANLFRIGASGLLADIEKELYIYAFNRAPPQNTLSPI